MDKPEVHIKEWGIYRRHYDSAHPWAISGTVIDHPRFDSGTRVTTSGIMSDHRNLHGGDRVETQNTIYILVGNNQNGSD